MSSLMYANTDELNTIDEQIKWYHEDIIEVSSYLQDYKRDSVLYDETYFSIMTSQQMRATDILIDLQAQKKKYISELEDIYKCELKNARNEKKKLFNTIKNLKMENKRLLESSNFYKAKAEKYHRHIKNKEKEQLLLQQQQKDQQQQQDMCIEELKDALHDQEEDHKAQLDDIKKFSDDIINMLTMKLQQEKENLLKLESVGTTSSLRNNSFSPFAFKLDASCMIYRSPPPSSSMRQNPSCSHSSISSVSPTAPLRYYSPPPSSSMRRISSSRYSNVSSVSPRSTYSEQDNKSRDRCTPPPLPLLDLFTSSPLPVVFTPPPPPPPPPIPYFLIQRPIQINEVSSCSTKSTHKSVNGLRNPYQQPTLEEDSSFIRIAKLSQWHFDNVCVPNRNKVTMKDKFVTNTKTVSHYLKNTFPKIFKINKKQDQGEDESCFESSEDTECNQSNKWSVSPDISEIQTIDLPRKRDIARRLWGKLMK
ncbi:hypothetical protein MOSE0_C04016 [Monosporozyma servazzii]